MTGYSGTPLHRKLGIREGATVGVVGAPSDFRRMLGDLPAGATVEDGPEHACDIHVVFCASAEALAAYFPAAMSLLRADGGLGVAWPKKASVMETDLDFGLVQRFGLDHGLVDNKVCSVDDTWSAVRFVVRRDDRDDWPDG